MAAASLKTDVSDLTLVATLTRLTAYEADDGLLFVAKDSAHQYSAGLLNWLQLQGHLRPLGARRPRGRGFYRIALDAGDADNLPDLREATQWGILGCRPLLTGPGACPVTFVVGAKGRVKEPKAGREEDSMGGFANDSGRIYGSPEEANRRWGR